MRFIVMHKVDEKMEAGAPPNQEIISAMGSLVRESLSNGVFQNGAGLHRSAQRVRLSFRDGRCTVTQGPYQGQNELVWAFAMIQTPAMQGAIEQASRYADLLGDSEIEIGPVVEAWDLGIVPKPAHIEKSRFLLLIKGNAATEGNRLDKAMLQRLGELEQQLTTEGVLLAAEKLAP
ncbi:MAG TPA: hypothetical protein VFQ61_31780, partial [Polyangiaceae bacterium]|nr:hypothetical protein [Polyangiaceae bacterium]